MAIGRFMTKRAVEPQKPLSLGWRLARPSLSLFTRSPSIASKAGRAISAPAIDKKTTTTPPIAKDFKKYCGKNARAESTIATVIPLNKTVLPAVTMVAITASFTLLFLARSSLNRLTISSE